MSHYHDETDMKLIKEMSKLSPDEFEAWLSLDNIVAREGGRIPRMYRELIADDAAAKGVARKTDRSV